MKRFFANCLAVLLLGASLGWAGNAPPHPKVTLEQARHIALQTYPGTALNGELEHEHGAWIYSFDIRRGKEPTIHEVQVDAQSGRVVSHTTETPSQEKQESKSEHQQPPKTP